MRKTLTRAVVASMAAAGLIGFMIPAATAATHPAGPLTRYQICGEYGCVENEGTGQSAGVGSSGTDYSDEYTTTWDGFTVHAWSSPDGNCLQGYNSGLREEACNDGTDEQFGLKSNGEWFNVGQSGDCAASPDVSYVIYVVCPDNPPADEQWTIG